MIILGKAFSYLRDYIKDDTFKINIVNGKIDIVNYTDIVNLDDNQIIVNSPFGLVVITGKDLVVVRLIENEILINGKVQKVELR